MYILDIICLFIYIIDFIIPRQQCRTRRHTCAFSVFNTQHLSLVYVFLFINSDTTVKIYLTIASMIKWLSDVSRSIVNAEPAAENILKRFY